MKRWLLRLYPKPFRRRFEDELIELLHGPHVRCAMRWTLPCTPASSEESSS